MEQLQGLLESCSPGDEATITVMVPDNYGQYNQEMTLTTRLSSAAETSSNNYIRSKEAVPSTAQLVICGLTRSGNQFTKL